MALHRIFQLTSVLRSAVSLTLRRNIGISAVLFNRAKELDPVQKLFLDKIRDYNSKSKSVQEPCIDRRSEPRSMALTVSASSCKNLHLLVSPTFSIRCLLFSQDFRRHRGRRALLPEEPVWGGHQTTETIRRRRPRQVPRLQIHRWLFFDKISVSFIITLILACWWWDFFLKEKVTQFSLNSINKKCFEVLCFHCSALYIYLFLCSCGSGLCLRL